MGRGRARIALGAAVGLIVLMVAGCGSQSHPNEQRPEPPTRVSVTISEGAVTVQPARVAFGPEPRQQIPQNQKDAQPRINGAKGPLQVVIVAANQTETASKLVIKGPKEADSEKFQANSPGSFQTELPSGVYVITASDVPGAKPGRLVVGNFRASSQNDVLLP
jgi:hypothetical protein